MVNNRFRILFLFTYCLASCKANNCKTTVKTYSVNVIQFKIMFCSDKQNWPKGQEVVYLEHCKLCVPKMFNPYFVKQQKLVNINVGNSSVQQTVLFRLQTTNLRV